MQAPSVTCRVIAFLVTGLLCGGSAYAETCGLTRMASLTVDRVPDGRILVPVAINGQPARLLLDTGSAITSSLFPSALDRLNLHSLEMQQRLNTASGKQISRFLTIKTLDIGEIHVEATQFMALPSDQSGHGVDGLMGPDIIRQLDVELDPAGGRINLFSQKHCPGQVVYWTPQFVDMPMHVMPSGHIFVDVTLDGQTLNALIDTGTSMSVMSILGIKRLFGLDPASPGVEAMKRPGQDATQPSEVYAYRFKSLSLAGIQVRNPLVALIPDRIRSTPDKAELSTPSLHSEPVKLPDLIIGMDILAKLRVYLAYGEQHFYASAANAT